MRRRGRRAVGRDRRTRRVLAAVTLVLVAAPGLPVRAMASTSVTIPTTPVGAQLRWLLGVADQLPLSDHAIKEHFDGTFLAQVDPQALNQALESLGSRGSAVTLDAVIHAATTSLQAIVEIGPNYFTVSLSVDPLGFIDGLLFSLRAPPTTTWPALDARLASVAPDVSFLAARVTPGGSCTSVHAESPTTERPLGSMFKLFVLGALARDIEHHVVRWGQRLTVTAAAKVGGSGSLQDVVDGTTVTVQQAALKMISESDNTAADLLLGLVGRTAVESQVRQWSKNATLDVPFLSVRELFALKFSDFPALADRYLALPPSRRAAFLASTVDKVSTASEVASAAPRDIDSLEWFASASTLCRAFAGLATLARATGLAPLATVLSTNTGGVALSATTWPTIWFKGGSEPGVLTLGYLAKDRAGSTDVVIVLTSNPTGVISEADTIEELGVVADAFTLLHGGHA
jgi:beta-lactamase class A